MRPRVFRRRVDWEQFFGRVDRPHGVRVRLERHSSTSPEAVTLERRLLVIVKLLIGNERFALRRCVAKGPAAIECVFERAEPAKVLAEEIGASLVNPPPLGWASAREVLADEQALRNLLRKGTDARKAPRKNLSDATPKGPAAGTRDSEISEARLRIGSMSLEQQARALFYAMIDR